MQIMIDGARLEEMIKEAGFIDIESKRLQVKIGEWGAG